MKVPVACILVATLGVSGAKLFAQVVIPGTNRPSQGIGLPRLAPEKRTKSYLPKPEDTTTSKIPSDSSVPPEKPEARKTYTSSESETTEGLLETCPEEKVGAGVIDACKEYLKKKYEDRSWSINYTHNAYDLNYKSSMWIFRVVILLVLSGLVLSATQFWIAMRPHPAAIGKKKISAAQAGPSESSSAMVSTIEASATGIKISSSVIGLLMLVVSLGFFYLYLVYVYPMKITGQ